MVPAEKRDRLEQPVSGIGYRTPTQEPERLHLLDRAIVQAELTRAEQTSSLAARFLALAIVLAIAAWTIIGLVAPNAGFHVMSVKAAAAIEAAYACACVLAGLVLFLFPGSQSRTRLRWLACGLMISAVGALALGLAQPLLEARVDPNSLAYAALPVRIGAAAFFVLGLIPGTRGRLARVGGMALLVACSVAAVAMVAGSPHLPRLIEPGLFTSMSVRAFVSPCITAWYVVLSGLPLVLSVAAAILAARRCREGALEGWILVAMVLFAGAQLALLFWPSADTSIVSAAEIRGLLFAGVVATGGVIELRRAAAGFRRLLDAQEEQSSRLAELGVLKANFTAMVAHELGSPLAAVRGFARMLETGELSAAESREAISAIQLEVGVLHALVRDVQLAASVERDDFAVQLSPVEVSDLVRDTTSFAATLPGNHQLRVEGPTDLCVWADPWRIGQVMRNLLSNAAKYSPEGAPIWICIEMNPQNHSVYVRVKDEGYGIAPEDRDRIFEKFGRGRDQSGKRIQGVGLGLYLSRRMIQAHGSDLWVQSEPGQGSTFSFRLEASR